MAVVVSVQDFVVVVCIFGSAFLCDVACCEGGFGMVQGMSWRSPRIFVSGNVEFVCKGCAVSHQGVPGVWPHCHQGRALDPTIFHLVKQRGSMRTVIVLGGIVVISSFASMSYVWPCL